MSNLKNFKRKVNSALKWAKDNDIPVSKGTWNMCPIGACLAQLQGVDALEKLTLRLSGTDNDRHILYRLGKKIGITVPEIREFITGVDSNSLFSLKDSPFCRYGKEVRNQLV